MYYGNVASGVVFSDTQLYSSDYSLQLSMSLQNYISRRCAKTDDASAPKPSICGQFAQWAGAQRKAIRDLMSFGTPFGAANALPWHDMQDDCELSTGPASRWLQPKCS